MCLQLPCRIGPQTTHSRVNEEQNKNCIIQISRYRFALVLDGFVKVLKRIHELVSVRMYLDTKINVTLSVSSWYYGCSTAARSRIRKELLRQSVNCAGNFREMF